MISGGILLGLALLGRLVTIPLPIPFLGDLALLVGLAGMFTLILGTKALSRYWFVFFFLVFMVPLPIAHVLADCFAAAVAGQPSSHQP